MQLITSPAEFDTLLKEEHAVVFLHFPWSNRSMDSKTIVHEWEEKLTTQVAPISFNIYELAPDDSPCTWKWLNESLIDDDETASVNGCVAWLKKGSVAGRVEDAAMAGTKILTRMTNVCFAGGETNAEASPFDPDFLQILCCPETHQKLKPASRPLIEKINQQIAAGRAQNRSGQPVLDPIDGGLVRADGRYLYPLRQNIPTLLVDEAIPLAGF